MGRKAKTLWISLAVTVLCSAIIVVTAVLLTGGTREGGHIEIEEPPTLTEGSLDLKLVRERLQRVTIDKDGLPILYVSDEFTDFSASNGNIFGMTSDLLIGPKCYFSATMAISNAEPYPFEYWLEIVPENGESLLADQLELKVTLGEEVFVERTLAEGLQTKVFPSVAANAQAKFAVTLTYLDLQENDLTKNTTLAFDIIVHARLLPSQ